MQIKVWHCYHYGRNDTTIILAETDEALKAKVRGIIALEWDEAEFGSLPEDYDDLFEAYDDNFNDRYFGDWGWSVIDAGLCEKGAM